MSRSTLLLLSCILFIPLVSFDEIIIRHDQPDESYLELGTRFRSSICHLNLPDCEGTIIGDRWVLTAAHCAVEIVQKLKEGKDHEVIILEERYEVDTVILHPGWEEDEAFDLALVRLKRAAAGVKPALLYRGDAEAGKLIYVVGKGDRGTGKTGVEDNDGRLRGATNRVDEASDHWLKWRFDAPGDPNVTELEGISGPGDSGGPAFLIGNDTLYIAGVSSGQATGGGPEGVYGVREYYTRVSRYTEWIEEMMD